MSVDDIKRAKVLQKAKEAAGMVPKQMPPAKVPRLSGHVSPSGGHVMPSGPSMSQSAALHIPAWSAPRPSTSYGAPLGAGQPGLSGAPPVPQLPAHLFPAAAAAFAVSGFTGLSQSSS